MSYNKIINIKQLIKKYSVHLSFLKSGTSHSFFYIKHLATFISLLNENLELMLVYHSRLSNLFQQEKQR